MRISEAEIEAMARHLVDGLIARGSIKPKAGADDIIAAVVELMSTNFETEAKLDDEADRMAEDQARKNPGVDATRLRQLIKQRLAEKQNFTI